MNAAILRNALPQRRTNDITCGVSAAVVVGGIEVAEKIMNGQFKLGPPGARTSAGIYKKTNPLGLRIAGDLR